MAVSLRSRIAKRCSHLNAALCDKAKFLGFSPSPFFLLFVPSLFCHSPLEFFKNEYGDNVCLFSMKSAVEREDAI
ncbi:hypothetical protein, partial [Vibrio parahaemolyticus]|uniref:hypothetical protein n=1 Tax=Vibrio parahaemolyticus TaxID=670 RepID=UPI001D1324CC